MFSAERLGSSGFKCKNAKKIGHMEYFLLSPLYVSDIR